jgi:hypothetical protein
VPPCIDLSFNLTESRRHPAAQGVMLPIARLKSQVSELEAPTRVGGLFRSVSMRLSLVVCAICFQVADASNPRTERSLPTTKNLKRKENNHERNRCFDSFLTS